MKKTLPTLYYIHDPMCSWCWGFNRCWLQVQQALINKVKIQYVLGGLAADTDQPMAESMQQTIRLTWQRIQQEIPGTDFNYNFWTECKPRRSTYPACRAIVAAGLQGHENSELMLSAIQQAYYQQARNPSDYSVLIQLAEEIGLDHRQFKADLLSEQCERLFEQQLRLTASLGVNSFPALVLRCNESNTMIYIDYTKSETIVSSILALT